MARRELHDALLTLIVLPPVSGWEEYFGTLRESRRATVLSAGGANFWVAAELVRSARLLYPDATLEPAINPPFTWVRWAFPFEAVAGKHAIKIRATDGNGEVATSEERSPLPDGATGWPRRSFKVE